MGTLIRLLIAALVINAVARAGAVWWRYYQFKDDTEQTIRFGGAESPGDLQARILEKAATYQIPIAPEAIDVQREGTRTTATASYDQPVELAPGYRRPLHLSFSVEAFSLGGAPVPSR